MPARVACRRGAAVAVCSSDRAAAARSCDRLAPPARERGAACVVAQCTRGMKEAERRQRSSRSRDNAPGRAARSLAASQPPEGARAQPRTAADESCAARHDQPGDRRDEQDSERSHSPAAIPRGAFPRAREITSGETTRDEEQDVIEIDHARGSIAQSVA